MGTWELLTILSYYRLQKGLVSTAEHSFVGVDMMGGGE